MDNDIVAGMCDLLQQSEHIDIQRFTIKACTYVSMNYDFVNEEAYSGPILCTFMELIDIMEQRNDQYNIIQTIRNILKGCEENKSKFI